jgi:cholesterol transport system auxiliary component
MTRERAMRWLVQGLSCAALAFALASCSILPPKQSPDIYVLPQPPATQASDAQPLPWQLRVDTPEAVGLLADNGIVVMPEPGRITVYTNARWSDNAPLLVRERLIDAFLDTHRLPAVTSEDDSMHADFVLAGDLRAFQSEYRNGSPVVVIRFDAQLRRGGSRNVLAARSFEVTATPSGVAVPQVVQAFGDACDQLSAQVVKWTLEQGQQASSQQQPPAVSGERKS